MFDFGLCKNLSPKLKTKDGMFKLTGRTGSFPYMAPGKSIIVLSTSRSFTLFVAHYSLHLLQILFSRGGSMQTVQLQRRHLFIRHHVVGSSCVEAGLWWRPVAKAILRSCLNQWRASSCFHKVASSNTTNHARMLGRKSERASNVEKGSKVDTS